MDIEEIRARLYDDFDAEGIMNRQEKQRQARIEQAAPPVDVYQQEQNRLQDVSRKSYPRGSSKAVDMSVYAVIDGVGAEGLAKAYKRAQDDIDVLKDQGERGRAQIRRQQYMQEDFLPAVEIVVNSTSPDEVLANKKALNELDKYALLEGSGKGYTATYIRQAYGNLLGQVSGRDDPDTRDAIMRINSLLDNGQVRTAVGIANRIKDKIDRGENQADEVDYELISRVVSFYK